MHISYLLLSENLMILLLLVCCCVPIIILNSDSGYSSPSTIRRPRKNQWRQCSLKQSNILVMLNVHLTTLITVLISPIIEQGSVAQSVMCQVTDACLTADPGVVSSILAWSHTFMEIDHEIISTVILLPSTDALKKGCCQLQAKVCALITG